MSAAGGSAAAGDHDRVRLERIVIGVDFSAPSVAAVGWTREHFAPDAECVVVHALDVPRPPPFLRGTFPSRDEVIRSARAGASARLERLCSGQEWGPVRLDVKEGRAEDVLADAAAETAADMVVVGEHGHPRGIWSTLGSTAEALVRRATMPVLLARSTPERAPQRILAAVDESAHARAVLMWTRMLARRFGAAVTAYHVFRPVFLGAARMVSGMEASAKLEREQLQQTQSWLEQLVRAAGFESEAATPRIEPGDPVSGLVAAQRGGAFDLVIIGSRGAGGAGRMLLGSVANGVLRGASCPVLVVSGSQEPGQD
jgi:nucleotide-binding universal stress UspA family protein